MAITQSSLAAKFKANIIALYGGGDDPDDELTLDRFCNALAKSVVDEIHEHAQVEIKAGDLQVNPGTFSNSGGSLSGIGEVIPTILAETRVL